MLRAVHLGVGGWLLLVCALTPAAQAQHVETVTQQRLPTNVPALIALLNDGQEDTTTVRIAEALGASRTEQALDALSRAMLHRLPTIRVAALHALGRFVGRPAVAQQVALGLRDSDSTVRAAATDALVSMHATTEVDTLFVAFARGVPEAAVAIGQLAADSALPKFSRFVGNKPIVEMLAGYRAWLLREGVRIETKLAIITTLENVAGLTVKRFLEELSEAPEVRRDATLQRAITATISHIPERPLTQERAP